MQKDKPGNAWLNRRGGRRERQRDRPGKAWLFTVYSTVYTVGEVGGVGILYTISFLQFLTTSNKTSSKWA